MNITVLQENLLHVLTPTTRILSSKAQLPVLLHVLLSAEGGQLHATTTNMEASVCVWAGAKIEKEGGVCVPSRLLTELVMTLPPDAVHLTVKDGSLVVSSGGTTATIPGMPPSEFPPVPAQKQIGANKIPKDDFCAALSLVLFAAATDEGRPLLTGVKIRSEEKGILLAATDGYRLSVKRVGVSLSQDIDLVIPARALGEVVRAAAEEKETTTLLFSGKGEGEVVFGVGDTQVTTRTIDGEYPGFDKIIPKSHTTRVLLEKEPLARAVKSASLFARDNANVVRLTIDKQTVSVSGSAAQLGENTVSLSAEVDGDGGEIAFNSRFLLDFFANFPDDELLFEMTGSLNPGVFRPTKDASFSHIIMPIRTTSG